MLNIRGQLLIVGAVALALAGCEKRVAGGDRVCADASGRRTSDWNCEGAHVAAGHGNPAMWYYLGRLSNGSGYPAPVVGAAVRGGSYSPTPGVAYGAPGFAQASMARGGFGATAHGVGAGE